MFMFCFLLLEIKCQCTNINNKYRSFNNPTSDSIMNIDDIFTAWKVFLGGRNVGFELSDISIQMSNLCSDYNNDGRIDIGDIFNLWKCMLGFEDYPVANHHMESPAPPMPSSPPNIPLSIQVLNSAIDEQILSIVNNVESYNISYDCDPGELVILYSVNNETLPEVSVFNVTEYTFVPSTPGIYNVYCKHNTFEDCNLNCPTSCENSLPYLCVVQQLATIGYENVNGTDIIVEDDANYETFIEILDDDSSNISTRETLKLLKQLKDNLDVVDILNTESEYYNNETNEADDAIVTYSIRSVGFTTDSEREARNSFVYDFAQPPNAPPNPPYNPSPPSSPPKFPPVHPPIFPPSPESPPPYPSYPPEWPPFSPPNLPPSPSPSKPPLMPPSQPLIYGKDNSHLLSPVISQGLCGNCYVVAAVTLIQYIVQNRFESNITDRPFDLSHFTLCFGTKKYTDEGRLSKNQCSGGFYANVWNKAARQKWFYSYEKSTYMKHLGYLSMSNELPDCQDRTTYLSNEYNDNPQSFLEVPMISGISMQYVPENKWIEYLDRGEILAIAIHAKSRRFQYYAKGKIKASQCNYPYGYNAPVDHAVILSGYKYSTSEKNDGYWIVRNSYGSNWGVNGYIYLDMTSRACNPSYAYRAILSDTNADFAEYQNYANLQAALKIPPPPTAPPYVPPPSLPPPFTPPKPPPIPLPPIGSLTRIIPIKSSMKSTGYGLVASNCYDDDPNTLCHSDESDAGDQWISFEFTEETIIQYVKIVNRAGRFDHMQRINPFRIFMSNSEGIQDMNTSSPCIVGDLNFPVTVTTQSSYVCLNGTRGKFFTIYLGSNVDRSRVLNLGEVYLFAYP